MFWHNYFLHEGNLSCVFSPKNWKLAYLKLRSRVLDLATGETLHFFSHRASWVFFFSVYSYTEFIFRHLCEVQYLTKHGLVGKSFSIEFIVYITSTERERKREKGRKRRKDKDFVKLMRSDSPLGGSALPYWTLLWKEEIIHLSERQSGTCRLIVIMLQVLQLFW